MKNVHLLPTNKPSRLIYNDANQLCYHSNKSYKNDRKWMHRKKFNIYITSDEQAKEGDWCLDIFTKSVFKYGKGLAKGQTTLLNATKKIILTTDQDLIKDGVQPIDDEFLNWFVKNPSCEFVETQCSGRNCIEDFGCTKEGCNGVEPLEIIIPQEELKQEYVKCTCANSLEYSNCGKKCERILDEQEPKQEPTLEEAKIDLTKLCYYDKRNPDFQIKEEYGYEKEEVESTGNFSKKDCACDNCFYGRSKLTEQLIWQQKRMYSNEEVIAIVEKSRETGLTAEYLLLTDQFKKK